MKLLLDDSAEDRKQEFLDSLPAESRTRSGRAKPPIREILRFASFGKGGEPIYARLIAPSFELIAFVTAGLAAATLLEGHAHTYSGPPIEVREDHLRELEALRSYFVQQIAPYGITIDQAKYEQAVVRRLKRRGMEPCGLLARVLLNVQSLKERAFSAK